MSSVRLEYCGDPQKPFFCLTYHPVESPVQFCSAFSSQWVSQPIASHPPKSNHCSEDLGEIHRTLRHKGVRFVSCFPYVGVFIFKVPHAQPGSLRSVSGAIQRALHGAGGGSCSKPQPCICQRRADSKPKRSLHLPVSGISYSEDSN